jgi:hypothetical protein
MHIYRAVLSAGIRTPDGFKTWLADHRVEGLTDWRPAVWRHNTTARSWTTKPAKKASFPFRGFRLFRVLRDPNAFYNVFVVE